MIPRRKGPQTGQQTQKPSSKQTSNTSIKTTSGTSTKTASKQTKPASKTNSQKQNDQNTPSIVELLQNQIEEERKKARNKNQIKSRQGTSSSQSRQVLQKKKNSNNNSTPTDNSFQDLHQSRPPPQPNQEKNNDKPKYVSIETSPLSMTEQTDVHKTEKVQMTAEAVGDDEAPKPKKLEPTGFTYFDKLNEKDIFLDPLKYF